MKKIMNKNVLIGFGFGFLLSAVLFFVGGAGITKRELSAGDHGTEEDRRNEGARIDLYRKSPTLQGAKLRLPTEPDAYKIRKLNSVSSNYLDNQGFISRLFTFLTGFTTSVRGSQADRKRYKTNYSCGINNYFDEYRYKTDVPFRCDLSGADLREKDLSGAILNFSTFYKADLSGANMSNIQAIDSNFEEANLSGANLTDAELPRARFVNADLSGADFTNADLFNMRLQNSNVNNANFTNAILYEAIFKEMDLSGADFTGAKVRPYQVEYLEAQGVSGFVVVEAPLVKFF